jgi:hypothetical protein
MRKISIKKQDIRKVFGKDQNFKDYSEIHHVRKNRGKMCKNNNNKKP